MNLNWKCFLVVYNAKCTRHLVVISRNGQKVCIQLRFDISLDCLIKISWYSYIMTTWHIASFWVANDDDWKLWTLIMIDWNDKYVTNIDTQNYSISDSNSQVLLNQMSSKSRESLGCLLLVKCTSVNFVTAGYKLAWNCM